MGAHRNFRRGKPKKDPHKGKKGPPGQRTMLQKGLHMAKKGPHKEKKKRQKIPPYREKSSKKGPHIEKKYKKGPHIDKKNVS